MFCPKTPLNSSGIRSLNHEEHRWMCGLTHLPVIADKGESSWPGTHRKLPKSRWAQKSTRMSAARRNKPLSRGPVLEE
ncbi:hypothetical protein NBRC3293_0954 [Gluconobacter oxydans NBRC 3293]|uniref:Uncharacterized protein n=1 Tax=Gluconobacter oxydans NBRC 3293 TaxID=1315969 RepID=A0A829X0N4_GLUOY|nr:hypothetical protein NBRC3293_0954 [Gluconobacter oxydans NBRC 3293]